LLRKDIGGAAGIDPGFARAFAGLAVTYIEEAVQFPPELEFKAAIAQGFSSAQQAVTIDNSECLGHASMGWSLLYRREYEQARKHVEFALKLNANDSDMLANAAYIQAMYGDVKFGQGRHAAQSPPPRLVSGVHGNSTVLGPPLSRRDRSSQPRARNVL
jgi:hypothetical protein